MKFLDKLFKKESKKTKEVDKKEVEEKKDDSDGKVEYCPSCGLEMIKGVHQTRILNGKRFHKLCARKLIKEAKKNAFG